MDTKIRAGAAAVNITPSVGFDNIGDYLRLAPAQGVGNELFAKALVLDDGENRVAIVTADVINFPDPLVADIRRRIGLLTGISGTNVLLSASHTHSSPATSSWDQPSKEYVVELSKKVAGAVYMADQNKRDALVGCGVGEAKVSINRWQRTETGVHWGPNPDAPADHEVPVMRVNGLDGKPIAILINFASHPSILGSSNMLYSGDYASYVQSVVEKAYGGGTTAMFCTGAGGDIKIAVLNEDGSQFRYTDFGDCRRYGTIIGAEAVKIAESAVTKPVEKISAKLMRVDLPLVQLPDVEEMKKIRDDTANHIARLEADGKRADYQKLQLQWAEETLKSIKAGTAPKTIAAEVQLIRIGDGIALFAVPGELFVEVGMNLKRAMGLPGSFVVAYSNGGVGYLPSKRAEEWGWCKHDSSYRITTHPANFSGAIEDVLVEALIAMMDDK